MNMNAKLKPQRKTPLQQMLSDMVVWMESTMRLEGGSPKCPCCGETENLVYGPSATGGTLAMCQDAARETLSRGE